MAQKFDEQLKILQNVVSDTRNLVLFVGAGVSVSAGYSLWQKATSDALNLAKDRNLIAFGAFSYAAEKLGKYQYYDVFEIIKRESTEAAYYAVVKDVFCKQFPPSEIHKLLVRIPCRGIITTNFDECLSTACANERNVMPISEISVAMASDHFFIIKPHGSILNPKSMVLTSQDWQKVESNGEFEDILA
jgi:NAD-dependent SIR2 family protein deacetylase